jgi:hypothetical protein
MYCLYRSTHMLIVRNTDYWRCRGRLDYYSMFRRVRHRILSSIENHLNKGFRHPSSIYLRDRLLVNSTERQLYMVILGVYSMRQIGISLGLYMLRRTLRSLLRLRQD